MKRRLKSIIAAAMTVATLFSTAAPAYAATFGSIFDGNGYWSDKSNLTWTFNDGGNVTIGRGSRFSDAHPWITDPEYLLKEAVIYQGEATNTLNRAGQPKANYTEGTLPLLQEFVKSFDWINSDELTRVQKVHERIANGRNGNEDQHSGRTIPAVSFSVLQYKIGNCGDYAAEFQRLASFVGLECVTYDQYDLHEACLVKINDQWITIDPFRYATLFDNTSTVPVDYDIEYNRYVNEAKNSEWYQNQMQEVEWQRQAEAGIITWREYFQKIYPDKTLAEIEQIIGMDMDSYEQLWKE